MREDPRYQKYIKSAAWDAKCQLYWMKFGRWCKACRKSSGPLQVHHMTYDRLGNERMSDLLGLCPQCHREAHEMHRKTGFNDLRTATMMVVRLKQKQRLSRRKA